MKARTLPKHIYALRGGLVVQVRRGSMSYQAYLPQGTPDILARAIELRDRFLAAAGPTLPPALGTSNTGIAGISEMVLWCQNRPRDCFTVHLGKQHKPQTKRIYYGSFRPRSEALRMAVEWRRSIGAVVTEQALKEAICG